MHQSSSDTGLARHAPNTPGAAGIAECASLGRHELPVVARGVQLELQYAKNADAAHLAVRLDRAKPVQFRAAHACDELAHTLWVGDAIGGLRGEALVDVIMPVQYYIGAGAGQDIPDRPHVRVVAVDAAR